MTRLICIYFRLIVYTNVPFLFLHLVGPNDAVCSDVCFIMIDNSLISQILEEEPDYPEALIGRGTAYAFQRELHAAIADFTKVLTE